MQPRPHPGKHAFARARLARRPGRALGRLAVTCWLLGATAALAADGPARIAASAWTGDAPTRVVDALGLLRDTEPVVVIDYFDSGRQALARLQAGDADFALSGNTPVAAHLLRSGRGSSDAAEDVVVLASLGLSTPRHLVIAARDRGISAPADLIGRRVAVRMATSAHFGWSRFAAVHGLEPGAVTLVDVPVAGLERALLDGDVDAVVSWFPWSDPLLEALGDNAVTMSTGQIYTVNWLLLTRRAVANGRPQLVDRVLSAYLAAIELIAAEPYRAESLRAGTLGVAADDAEPLEAGAIWNPVMNWSVLANMENALAWLHELPGFSGSRVPAPAEYLDAGALQRVAPENLMLPHYLLERPREERMIGR